MVLRQQLESNEERIVILTEGNECPEGLPAGEHVGSLGEEGVLHGRVPEGLTQRRGSHQDRPHKKHISRGLRQTIWLF